MNEIRDLIVGIDFGREYSQICYYDRKGEEPRSLSMKVGGSQYEAPTCLCRRTEQKDYCVGLEAEYFAREKGGIMIDDLYGICQKREKVMVAGTETEPWGLLAQFLNGMLKFLGITELVKNTKCIVVTLEELGNIQVENFRKAFSSMGFPEGKYMLQDYAESFYYYVLSQKKEIWNRSVAWYAFTPEKVIFRKLTLNGGTRPVLVKLEDPVETDLNDSDNEQRDADFYTFAKNTLGSELYSSIQIDGEGFDQEWAQKSVKLLCYQKRKVFYGNNLFAKGACAAGAERFLTRKLRDYRYLSSSLVLKDVGMDMRVMGAQAYYPLIEAGRNWYECRAECELILDGTDELIFVASAMGESEKKYIGMRLPGLPKRPNKTTRLDVKLQYISQDECEIMVTDLGFGEMFPSSGKVWKETTRW